MYYVQTGKGRGKYKTDYSTGSLAQATALYWGINLLPGYKKRLVDDRGKVLFRNMCII